MTSYLVIRLRAYDLRTLCRVKKNRMEEEEKTRNLHSSMTMSSREWQRRNKLSHDDVTYLMVTSYGSIHNVISCIIPSKFGANPSSRQICETMTSQYSFCLLNSNERYACPLIGLSRIGVQIENLVSSAIRIILTRIPVTLIVFK